MLSPAWTSLFILGLFLPFSSSSSCSASQNDNEGGLDCWDICMAEGVLSGNDEIKDQYMEFFKLTEMAREMRILKGINSTAILLDTSVHPKHARDQDFGGIFTFEQNLAAFFAYTMPASRDRNPFFGVQFDGEQAWSCSNWSCNERCDAADIMLNDFEDVLVSDAKGKLEDACHLAHRAMRKQCGGGVRKPLLISIVNSPFDDHILTKHHAFESACKLFNDRLIIGTHASNRQQLKKWASKYNYYYYIEDTPLAKKVLEDMVDCLKTECCATVANNRLSRSPSCIRTVPGYSVHNFKWSSS